MSVVRRMPATQAVVRRIPARFAEAAADKPPGSILAVAAADKRAGSMAAADKKAVAIAKRLAPNRHDAVHPNGHETSSRHEASSRDCCCCCCFPTKFASSTCDCSRRRGPSSIFGSFGFLLHRSSFLKCFRASRRSPSFLASK